MGWGEEEEAERCGVVVVDSDASIQQDVCRQFQSINQTENRCRRLATRGGRGGGRSPRALTTVSARGLKNERESPRRTSAKKSIKMAKTHHHRLHAINTWSQGRPQPSTCRCRTTGMFTSSKNCNCGTSTVFRAPRPDP